MFICFINRTERERESACKYAEGREDGKKEGCMHDTLHRFPNKHRREEKGTVVDSFSLTHSFGQ